MRILLAALAFDLRLVVGAVFVISAARKMRHIPGFANTILLLGIHVGNGAALAWIAVSAELVVGALILAGVEEPVAALAAVTLSLLFVVASILALAGHRNIPCRCFGERGGELGSGTLIRGVSLAIVASCLAYSVRIGISANPPTSVASFIIGVLILLILSSVIIFLTGKKAEPLKAPVHNLVLCGTPLPELFGRWIKTSRDACWSEVLRDQAGSFLFLDARCTICRTVAAGIKFLPGGSITTFLAGPLNSVMDFLSETGLQPERVIFDEQNRTSTGLGLRATPVAIAIRSGLVTRAAMIFNIEQAGQVFGLLNDDSIW